MSLVTNYNVGGVIDEVKNIKIPGLIASMRNPFAKGFKLDVPAIPGVYTIEYLATEDIEIVNVGIACSGYSDEDFWELIIGDKKLYETIYTKELPETINMGGSFISVYLVEANTLIKLGFHNVSGTSKTVWVNMRFLKN